MAGPSLASRQEIARARWAALGDRLRTVTPQAVGRFALAASVIVGTGAVAVAAGPSLAPFIAGALIAYAVLPIANRLDAFMPRALAAVVAELVALAILVGAVVLVVPPLLRGLGQVLVSLPTPEEVQAGLANLEANLGQLPAPLNTILLEVAQETVVRLNDTLDALVSGAATFVTNQILGIVGTVSFVLGLLVIPAWILTLVKDEARLVRAGRALIAPAIREDVVALVRIVDRALGSFLRVQVVLAMTTGALVYLGLAVIERLGVAEFNYEVAAAVLLGGLQLIPELGFLLGFLPIGLVLAVNGPVPAAVLVAVYVAGVRLADLAIAGRLKRGVLDVNPLLLLPALVVLSDLGPLWLLVAAPIVVVLRDTVRYLAGRLGEPPRPAGVLPGDRRRGASPAAVIPPSVYADAPGAGARPSVYADAAPRVAPVPSVYRTAERSTS